MPINNKLRSKWLQDGKLKRYGQPQRENDQVGFLGDILGDIGEEMTADLKQQLIRKKQRASKALWQSIRPMITAKGSDVTQLEIRMESYWQQAAYGQKPGTWPNYISLREWMVNKGLTHGKSKHEIRSLQFLIARAIHNRGTVKRFGYKGSNFVEETLTKQYMQNISNLIGAVTGKTIAISLVLSAEEAKKQYKL